MYNFAFKKLNSTEITEDLFSQIMNVENSTGSGYEEDVLASMWLDKKLDNFVCMHGDKVVAIASFNPFSSRRNGSIYMINLTVLQSPEYLRKGIAQNLILSACKYYQKLERTLPMSTSVDKTNLPAINLYKKSGFKIVDPVCEIDEDDEQFILEAPINLVIKTIEAQLAQKDLQKY